MSIIVNTLFFSSDIVHLEPDKMPYGSKQTVCTQFNDYWVNIFIDFINYFMVFIIFIFVFVWELTVMGK